MKIRTTVQPRCRFCGRPVPYFGAVHRTCLDEQIRQVRELRDETVEGKLDGLESLRENQI